MHVDIMINIVQDCQESSSAHFFLVRMFFPCESWCLAEWSHLAKSKAKKVMLISPYLHMTWNALVLASIASLVDDTAAIVAKTPSGEISNRLIMRSRWFIISR